MAQMTIRTTVAFDLASKARLERLATRWGVSKSEVLRRVLKRADEQARIEDASAVELTENQPDLTGMSPLEIIDWLKENPQHPPGTAERWIRELREEREAEAERYHRREREMREANEAESLRVAEDPDFPDRDSGLG